MTTSYLVSTLKVLLLSCFLMTNLWWVYMCSCYLLWSLIDVKETLDLFNLLERKQIHLSPSMGPGPGII